MDSNFFPQSGQACSLTDCTAGKVFLMVAAVGVLGSVGSWGNFGAALLYEAIIGTMIALLCRGCSSKWPWVLLLFAAALPAIIAVGFTVGAVTSSMKTE